MPVASGRASPRAPGQYIAHPDDRGCAFAFFDPPKPFGSGAHKIAWWSATSRSLRIIGGEQ